MRTILNTIVVLRKKKGLCQEDMAKSLNLSTAAYSKMEAGQTNMSLSRFFEIAALLDPDPYMILDLEEGMAIAEELDQVVANLDACTQKIIDEQRKLIKIYDQN